MVVRRNKPNRADTNGQAGVEVLLVGPGRSRALDELGRRLNSRGWATARLDDAGALPNRVGPRHRAVVVVHACEGDLALEVLERLHEKRHSTLVIALADHAAPGEYYLLMQAGAVQYFEVGEDPGRILQGVEWAARALAP